MRTTFRSAPSRIFLNNNKKPALTLRSAETGAVAQIWIVVRGRKFELDAIILSPTNGFRPDHPEWYFRQHLIVMLDPFHDHATRWRYRIEDDGKLTSDSHIALPGEEIADQISKPLPAPPKAVASTDEKVRGTRRYRLRLTLPKAANNAGPIGLSLIIGQHQRLTAEPLCWPQAPQPLREVPLHFGDLYPRKGIVLDELVVKDPVWHPHPTRVSLKFSGTNGARKLTHRVEINARGVTPGAVESISHARANPQANLNVEFPPAAKWYPGATDSPHIRVAISQGRKLLWQARYPFGFDSGIIVREKFGSRPLAPRPRPADKDFVSRFRQYILTRLPEYSWRTTRDGAPSDFSLRGSDRTELDLMDPQMLTRAAELICSRTGQWQDALCAAAMWVHNPLISRHSQSWARLVNHTTINTIVRMGRCFCCDSARVLARLADHIGTSLKVPLCGYTLGLRGHITTLVTSPVGDVIIDGMMGLWFHTLDNSRLATLEEMRQDRRIVENVWASPRTSENEFFFGVNNQILRPCREGHIDWPSKY